MMRDFFLIATGVVLSDAIIYWAAVKFGWEDPLFLLVLINFVVAIVASLMAVITARRASCLLRETNDRLRNQLHSTPK